MPHLNQAQISRHRSKGSDPRVRARVGRICKKWDPVGYQFSRIPHLVTLLQQDKTALESHLPPPQIRTLFGIMKNREYDGIPMLDTPTAHCCRSKASRSGLRYSNYFSKDGSDAIKGPIQLMVWHVQLQWKWGQRANDVCCKQMMMHYIWYGVILIVLNLIGRSVLFYWTLPLCEWRNTFPVASTTQLYQL